MSLSPMDLVAEAKKEINECDIATAKAAISEKALILDVRERAEFDAGHLDNAIHIPRGVVEFQIGAHPAFEDKSRQLICYCKSGGRSALASHALQRLGFSNISSLAGGFDAWAAAGETVVKDPTT